MKPSPLIFPGDVFCVRGDDSVVPRGIRFIEKLWAKDGRARYNHAGIVTSADGKTFEALSDSIRESHLDYYRGKEVIISRPVRTVSGGYITAQGKRRAITICIRDHDGQVYPRWRLLLHTIPALAKMGSGKYLVCSELVEKYLTIIHADDRMILGVNPDDLGDSFRRWWNFQLIYEGVWE